MCKRGAAHATARSPVASRTPLSGSGVERTARRVEGVAHGRLAVGPGHELGGGFCRHLEVLQWARANGCPWDIRTCHKAAGGGHLKVLLWARKNGCPCDENELHIASLNGQVAMVRALIDAGADVNQPWDNGAMPLCIAAEKGHEAIVQALIKLSADVNKPWDDGATPLLIAAQNGHEAIVRALIELGADVNKAVDDGSTPLHMAAREGQEALMTGRRPCTWPLERATRR